MKPRQQTGLSIRAGMDLRNVRLRAALSQAECAKAAKTSQASFCLAEAGWKPIEYIAKLRGPTVRLALATLQGQRDALSAQLEIVDRDLAELAKDLVEAPQ